MEAKIKHLELIQITIDRMAGNSFLLKGWAITVVAGNCLRLKDLTVDTFYIPIRFVFLDGYYLHQAFRKLLSYVRRKYEINFSMKTDKTAEIGLTVCSP